MLPKWHILFGALISLMIYFILPQMNFFEAFIIFLSSVLIDFDHYLYYVYKKRDLSLRKAYGWYIKKSIKWKKISRYKKLMYKKDIMLFHGIECLILLILLWFLHPFFELVLIGVLLHISFDFLDIYLKKEVFYPKISQIYTWIKNRNLKEFY